MTSSFILIFHKVTFSNDFFLANPIASILECPGDSQSMKFFFEVSNTKHFIQSVSMQESVNKPSISYPITTRKIVSIS